jgi:hypothetical protein
VEACSWLEQTLLAWVHHTEWIRSRLTSSDVDQDIALPGLCTISCLVRRNNLLHVSDLAHEYVDPMMERADHVLVPIAESLDGVYDIWVLVAAGVAIRALGWVPCIRIFDEAQTGQDNQEDRDEALHDADRQCVANVDSYRFGGRDIDGRVLSDEVALA